MQAEAAEVAPTFFWINNCSVGLRMLLREGHQMLAAISRFSHPSKENLNRSTVSIWLDHDGFKGGSIMSP